LIAALLFVISALYLGKDSSVKPDLLKSKYRYIHLIIGIVITGLWIYDASLDLSRIFHKYPIDSAGSDIVPSIQLYVQRLLAGESVYAPMPFTGYTLQPTYLTMMWLPFIPAEWMNIDYRWMPFIYFILSYLAWLFYAFFRRLNPLEWLMKLSIGGMMILLICKHIPANFMHSVELLPVAFYLFLCLSLLHRNIWIASVGILLCLLSRYSFTFWLPVYLLILWGEYGFKYVFKLGMIVLAGILLLYFIPFVGKDIDIFLNGLKYYSENALGKWSAYGWQPDGAKPYHLSRGFGLAVQFYSSQEGELIDRLNLLRNVQLTISIVLAICIYLGYFTIKKRNYDLKLYLMISLKLYIVVFYSLLHVPYSYLFLLPCLLIIPILFYSNYSFRKIREI
jgi:hypothetical protein